MIDNNKVQDITMSEKFEQYSILGNVLGQTRYKSPNGHGASVICHLGSYGYEQGLCEIAVIKYDGETHLIDYSTSITDDVIGNLNKHARDRVLQKIFDLK